MQKLIRLSKECVASFGEPSSVKLSKLGLHAYRHNGNILILEQDGNKQSREKSYNPYDNNVLLKPTPEFIYDEKEWAKTAIHKSLPNLSDIKIPVINVDLNFLSGWFYDGKDSYIATRFYYVIDGRTSVTVSAFLDDKLRTNIKSNRVNVILDRTIFNSCIDLRFIDLPTIVSSDDQYLKSLTEHLFGPGKHTISELFMEYSVIKMSQVVAFFKNDFPFTRFYITEQNKTYRTNDETDNSLRLIATDWSQHDNGTQAYELSLFHDKTTVEKYLSTFLTDLDTWSISYEATTVAYNNDGTVIGSLAVSLSNPSDPFSSVYFRPVILYDWINSNNLANVLDHCEFDIRAVARTSISGLEIIRRTVMIDNNPIRWVLGEIRRKNDTRLPNINIVKKPVIHKMEVSGDMPSVIKISKPVYVFAQPPSKIKLMNYNNTISIKLGEGIDTSIKLRLGNRDYEAKSIIGDSAVFTIEGSEYFKDTKVWYVLDKDDNIIASGDIEKP